MVGKVQTVPLLRPAEVDPLIGDASKARQKLGIEIIDCPV
jgi:GDP-D-mannose dehydratase